MSTWGVEPIHWFRNIHAAEEWHPGYRSLDYSLQLRKGIEMFSAARTALTPSDLQTLFSLIFFGGANLREIVSFIESHPSYYEVER